jgi:hypothetical protein
MALQKIECDCCKTILMRDDWDGQYYIEDSHGLWNKITPYIDKEEVLVCSEQCFLDNNEFKKQYYYILHNHYKENLCDTIYQAYKDRD